MTDSRKKILIVIDCMGSGGAQKSLLSFLTLGYESGVLNRYRLDVMVARPDGLFYPQIPEAVHLIPAPDELIWLGAHYSNPLIREHWCLKGILGKLFFAVNKKLHRFDPDLNEEQKIWESWKKLIPAMPEYYDTAISYTNGYTNYYVMEKVNAGKKILWIHNEYQKIGYSREYDRSYYGQCDSVITISSICADSFSAVFPEYKDKVHVLANITDRREVLRKGEQGEAIEYNGFNGIRLLSIARLYEQKGVDYAVLTAAQLRRRGVAFLWLVVGEGEEWDRLQELIRKEGVQDCFRLIGVRENPYVYLKACDIFVQTSRYEGKSIVLDEAKIFCRPIVVTNYPTVYDSIRNEENGLIVDLDPFSIADGIERLIGNPSLREQLTSHLWEQGVGNEAELARYIDLMFEI